MANAPISIPRPPFAYFLGKVGSVAPERLDAVMQEIGARVLKDWETKYRGAIEAMALRKPEPRVRWLAYLQFTDARWQELAARFPQDFDDLWADYMALKERAAAGDFEA